MLLDVTGWIGIRRGSFGIVEEERFGVEDDAEEDVLGE